MGEWLDDIRAKMLSLQVMPERCSISPENIRLNKEVRHTFLGIFHVVFTIKAGVVLILTVRHGRRLPAPKRDISKRLEG